MWDNSSSDYTGTSDIARMVWNVGEDNDYSSWERMRSTVAEGNSQIEIDVSLLLGGNYPIFNCGPRRGHSVKTWKANWDAFIRSWAEVYASQNDYDRAGDEEEMAEMLEEYGMMEVIEGETVDAFNERLWQNEVEGTMDALSDDFAELAERLAVARTMYLAQTGQAVY
jgi:hypothetical protein